MYYFVTFIRLIAELTLILYAPRFLLHFARQLPDLSPAACLRSGLPGLYLGAGDMAPLAAIQATATIEITANTAKTRLRLARFVEAGEDDLQHKGAISPAPRYKPGRPDRKQAAGDKSGN